LIEIQCIGAARQVTGSKHVVRTARATILLDCGLYQGRRKESAEQNRAIAQHVPIDDLDAVVLSHAHIDHAGALPLLSKRGYQGPIYATPATRDLCGPMLLDAAMIQEADARHIQKLIDREHLDMEPAIPLYDHGDVTALLGQMVALPYRRGQEIAPGVVLKFLDAGHVLGSAVVVLDVEEDGTRIAFAVDLGRKGLPILREPEIPGGVNCLIMESTYGDRLHAPIEEVDSALAAAINRTAKRGGKIIIPSFALERAQEVVYSIKRLRKTNQVPALPVYVDSPLTVKLTDVFKMHPECYDKETYALLVSGDSPFDFDGLHYVSDTEESKALAASAGPHIIISASGMCEAGRILHHLREGIEDPRNTILIVGYQAQSTLGRRIVERQREVKIFGVMRRLAAEVVVLNGFSAHADQKDLIDFAEGVRNQGKLRQVLLVHGEPPAQAALIAELGKHGFATVQAPGPDEKIRV
jgi:metallo-beta-lactamase family protein